MVTLGTCGYFSQVRTFVFIGSFVFLVLFVLNSSQSIEVTQKRLSKYVSFEAPNKA